MKRAEMMEVWVALVVVLLTAAQGQAQEAPSDSLGTANGGVYVGGQVGVLGGAAANSTGLFHRYDFVDGSGPYFSGFKIGYDRRWRSGLVLGGVGDIGFGAEPAGGGSVADGLELFGSVRARAGVARRGWLAYGTGGFAWARERVGDAAGGDASSEVFVPRNGWIVGGGIQRALDERWSADAEFLHSQFGSALSSNQLVLGLHYALRSDLGSAERPLGIAPLDLGGWSVHGQTTFLVQYASPFEAPYRGANSLDPNTARETWDVTFYLGGRLWSGAALWVNPEIDQGYGLSNTLGVAGFTSGEAYKVGHTHPYARIPRAFIQQNIDLGGETQSVDPGPNQLKGRRTSNRLVATFGKFSVTDVFDTIGYAHDPRGDFMNWSLADVATFDYAADAWGFTYGAALEWYHGRWVARGGVFALSQVPNSVDLDTSAHEYQIIYELEHQHTVNGQPGKIALVGFVSRGRMGTYADAIARADQTDTVPDTTDVRRYNTRPGASLNISQQIADGVGVFGRVGWADGHVEPYEFTDVDRTASGGVSFDGRGWGRRRDTVGVAYVGNAISALHQAYLADGGLGILVGDGQLPHPGVESIVEGYYRMAVGAWQVTGDYQFVLNPALNRDRGPVSVFALRVHTGF